MARFPTTYSDKTDAVERHIRPSLGDYADEHDLDTIFTAAFRYSPGRQGFFVAVDDERYWEIVQAAAK